VGTGTGAGAGTGGATAPGEGGATPIIVAFMRGLLARLAGFGADTIAGAGAIAGGGLADVAAGETRGAVGGAFTISIVPLNFGAAAPFKLKAHFWQAAALSSFCVPQFGQNTLRYLR
jgi:hypothetical protein